MAMLESRGLQILGDDVSDITECLESERRRPGRSGGDYLELQKLPIDPIGVFGEVVNPARCADYPSGGRAARSTGTRCQKG